MTRFILNEVPGTGEIGSLYIENLIITNLWKDNESVSYIFGCEQPLTFILVGEETRCEGHTRETPQSRDARNQGDHAHTNN